MRRKNWFLAALVLALLTGMVAEAQFAIEKAPLSTASGFLRITYDPDSGLESLIPKLIVENSMRNAVAQISPEAAKAEGKVTRIDLQKFAPGFRPGAVSAEVKLDSYDERVPADKLMEKLKTSLQDELRKLDTSYRTADERRERLANQLEKAGDELVKQKDKCHTLAQLHKVPATPEIAAEQRARLDTQIEKISAELVGLEARSQAIELQIAQAGKSASEAVAKDPVVAELAKSVEFRQAIVATRRAAFHAAKVTEAELLAAESELAEHKAELAKFRREANQLAGGLRLVELRRRLEDTAIEQAEAKAKLAALTKMRDGIGFSAQLDIQRLEVERLENAYRELAHDLDQLVHKLKLYQPPTVTLVLGKVK